MPLMQIGVRHYEAGEFLKTKSNHYSGTMTEGESKFEVEICPLYTILCLLSVANKIRKRVDIDIGYHVVPKSREHLLEHTPKPDQLPERSMQDSYTSALLPLENDEMSRERYTNHIGAVRMGRLMEELDMFAGTIAPLAFMNSLSNSICSLALPSSHSDPQSAQGCCLAVHLRHIACGSRWVQQHWEGSDQQGYRAERICVLDWFDIAGSNALCASTDGWAIYECNQSYVSHGLPQCNKYWICSGE